LEEIADGEDIRCQNTNQKISFIPSIAIMNVVNRHILQHDTLRVFFP
jgi:hypothetical protein